MHFFLSLIFLMCSLQCEQPIKEIILDFTMYYSHIVLSRFVPLSCIFKLADEGYFEPPVYNLTPAEAQTFDPDEYFNDK